jgi:hypothetical protein
VEEQPASISPKGSVNALRRVQSNASPSLPSRVVRFRTLYLPLRPPSARLWAAFMPLSKSASALKNLSFSPLLGGHSGIFREAA